jgi:acetyl-CoA carboxylase carboxyl transferase subunit beta
VTAAEPGAQIGFLGPRVYQALYGRRFPEDVQTAENLAERGLVDAVVAPPMLREIAIKVLNVLASTDRPGVTPAPPDEEVPDVAAWDAVERSRRTDRPGVRALLRHAANNVTPLQGTGEGEHEPSLLLALARFGTTAVVVLGQDRRYSDLPLGPASLREARRGMRLASELRIPLVTVIDTAGAALSREAEEGGLAGEIARCLADLMQLTMPTVSVLLGQGGGGAALALLPADRIVAASNAWLSPLPPEGAAVIAFRDAGRAAEIAAAQGIRAADLLRAGVVDRVVVERPDAADEPTAFMTRLGALIEYELSELAVSSPDELVRTRLEHFRAIGIS